MYGQTSAVDEAFLAPLGVRRIPVPVPFIEAGGPVNVYALLDPDGRWTLFDTGLSSPDALSALRYGAQEAGVNLRALSRIVVSHGHVDHYGNAQQLAEESGARVFVHPADLEKLTTAGRASAMVAQHAEYFRKLGVPPEVLELLVRGSKDARPWARAVDRARLEPLADGQVFSFAHFEASVLHCPGHTPGLVCLHVPARRLLFADDHLLANISPNPLLDLSQGEGRKKFLALVRYLESARRVYALDLDCVLPGHGAPFVGHRSLLDGLLEFYGRRQQKILRNITEKPATIYGLLEAIFLRKEVPRMLFMISEVLAHVEVMELEGKVRRELDDGQFVFHPA